MSKTFIDTNILVYTMDGHYPAKRKKCRSLLKGLKNQGTGVISTQVLQEFYVVCTKKLEADPVSVKSILHHLKNFEVVTVDPEIIGQAIDCSILNRISFWDAQIVVSAEAAKCTTLLTEDLNDGQVIQGVQIKNPL